MYAKTYAKTQVSLRKFLQCEVKIIHIILQNNTYLADNIIYLQFLMNNNDSSQNHHLSTINHKIYYNKGYNYYMYFVYFLKVDTYAQK